ARAPRITHTWTPGLRASDRPERAPSSRCGSSFPAGATSSKVVRNLIERREAHARVPHNVVVEALQHHEHLRPTRYVGMDRHREDRIVILAVPPIELVQPALLKLVG